jgi:putative tryptophan/tyrosine transport system substrate-binding protein
MRRREFIAVLGGAAAWPVMARAQQRQALPVVAFIAGASLDASGRGSAAFRAGLGEFGYVDGQNVSIEYHGLEGRYDRAPAVTAELARRRVAVIATTSPPIALAAKNATATIPIVFAVGGDPVKLGLVASLARPGRDWMQFPEELAPTTPITSPTRPLDSLRPVSSSRIASRQTSLRNRHSKR